MLTIEPKMVNKFLDYNPISIYTTYNTCLVGCPCLDQNLTTYNSNIIIQLTK